MRFSSQADQTGSPKLAPTVGVSGHRQVERTGSTTAFRLGSPGSNSYETSDQIKLPKGGRENGPPTAAVVAPVAQGRAEEVTHERVRVKPRKRKRPSEPPSGTAEVSKADRAPVVSSICIAIPFTGEQCDICGAMVTSTSGLVDHITSKHSMIRLAFKCSKCGKENAKRHSIACHLPKCKGGQVAAEARPKAFCCEACPGSFGTASGLSQHMRHRHIARCNEERIQQEGKMENRKKGLKKWSPDETRAMEKLNHIYRNTRSPERHIAEGLGTNTSVEQVERKRRKLALDKAPPGYRGPSWDSIVHDLTVAAEGPPAVTGVEKALREHMWGAGEVGPVSNEGVGATPQGPREELTEGREAAAAELVALLGRAIGKPVRPKTAKTPPKARRRWMERRRAKSEKFKQHQRLFEGDRGKLGKLILDGADNRECHITIEALTEAYTAQWGKAGKFGGLGQFRSSGGADNSHFCTPITASEALANLKAITKDSAAGPDGINRKGLLEWDSEGEKLAGMFAVWQLAGRIPKIFKQGRTTLIPKSMEEEELKEIGGWRPITIGSMVLRLFSKILTGRLEKACPINPRQRGFIAAPGCAENGEGYMFDGKKVTTLAFADDLVLMSDSWAGMQHNINIVETFCKLADLHVQPKKCHGFMVRRGGTAFTINNCQQWAIGGEKLHLIDPDKTEKYLGMKINPWLGVVKPDLGGQVAEWVSKIDHAALKPSQKVTMLNSYAIPRVIYTVNHGDIGKVELASLDMLIKTAVKSWLRLPPSACDGLLYARNKDSGLGLVKLESVIPAMQARRIFSLAISSDPLTRAVAAYIMPQEEYEKRWVRAGGEREQTPKLGGRQEATPAEEESPSIAEPEGTQTIATPTWKNPANWRLREFDGWASLPVQGEGIGSFHQDTISNSWLADPSTAGFRERHYMAALQLRANVYPTKEALARGRNKEKASCRRCDHKLETVSHILGQCPGVKAARLRRHDLICELLAEEAEKRGWTVTKELRVITAEGGLRVPDLLFVRGRLGIVAGVTVRYERNEDTLEKGRAEKVEKYLPIAPIIAKQFSLSRVLVYGFPMGGRGKWPTSNFELLRALGLSKSRSARFAAVISRRTLLYSLDILRAFGLECKVGQPAETGREDKGEDMEN
ncbi:uncharacterized protein LOC129850771 [Salvelinus fontinalis]|uniref:uncharacterized protein LOC129850771 n=1 Tax=Salvelinus fontinalis TaxID=8038 RepID=UPI0024867035|nr:uncharacterized protein LOC129850771 [Salvelinus fontinalis]